MISDEDAIQGPTETLGTPLRVTNILGTEPEEKLLELQLRHDERQVRRRTIQLSDGRRIFFHFASTVNLHHGDVIVLENKERLQVAAAEEDIFRVKARDSDHLTELAWHLGNRHLATEVRSDELRILQDHVIKSMLKGLGATVIEARAPFVPVRGAYSGDSHAHQPEHSHSHDSH